jgi:hypothetical protein
LLQIKNVDVCGLDHAVAASGYPTSTASYCVTRASMLGSCKPGTGHDCYLKGITVIADVTAPQYWWLQFQRYHFADIISSESKMHTLLKMDLTTRCNQYVDPVIIGHLNKLIYQYNNQPDIPKDQQFQRIIANCPMGLMLKAAITTNYLQLKTIYHQRKNHRLKEWHMFCNWIKDLPLFATLVLSPPTKCKGANHHD